MVCHMTSNANNLGIGATSPTNNELAPIHHENGHY